MILLTLFFYYNCFEALIFSLLSHYDIVLSGPWHTVCYLRDQSGLNSLTAILIDIIVMFSLNITFRCNSYCCTMYLDAMLLLYQHPVALVAIRGAIDMLFSNLQLLGASALLPICIPTKISIYSGTISKLFQASLSAQYGSG